MLGDRTNELYQLDTRTLVFSLITQLGGDAIPAAVSGHSATMVAGAGGADTMLVLGGSQNDGYNTYVHEFDVASSTWTRISPIGSRVQLAGHSATFYAATGLVYVFGGYGPQSSGFSQRSSELYTYSPTGQYWASITSTNDALLPQMAFHSATLLGDTVVHFGGNRHEHYQDEECHVDETWIYSLRCNSWLQLDTAGSTTALGRSSHAAVALDDTIYVVGGYSGVVHGDAIMMTPSGLLCANLTDATSDTCTEPASCASPCRDYGSCRPCTADSSCHWETSRSLCEANAALPVAGLLNIDTIRQPSECPGELANVQGYILEIFSVPYQSSFGNAPVSHEMLSTCASSETVSADYIEVISGTMSLPTGNHTLYLTTTTVSTLELFGESFTSTILAQNSTENLTVSVESSDDTLVLKVLTQGTAGSRSVSVTYVLDGSSSEAGFLPAEYSSPIMAAGQTCSARDDCQSCSADYRCAWCVMPGGGAGNLCQDRNETSACLSVALESETCVVCGDFDDCADCADTPLADCAWQRNECALRTTLDNATAPVIADSAQCPITCSQRANCSECLTGTEDNAHELCSWCSSSNTCMDYGDYTMDSMFGQCQTWAVHTEGCPSCSEHTSCSSCLARQDCGWCQMDAATFDTVGNGTCIDGTSTSYLSGTSDSYVATADGGTCSFDTPLDPAPVNCTGSDCFDSFIGQWTYDQCPNLNECARNTSQCGPNATCFDTVGFFYCACDDGYNATGGRVGGTQPIVADNILCAPKCCVNAVCDLPYDCQCNAGWTDTNCTVDCGCNGHAICPDDTGDIIGQCDTCLHNTMGATCDTCAPGYFGDPTDGGSCAPCNCAGHGDAALGSCNSTSGECYCTDRTVGFNCEGCVGGYSRSGSDCYTDCEFDIPRFGSDLTTTRQKLTGASLGIWTQQLRDSNADHHSTTCMWYIEAPNSTHTIKFTFEELNTECFYDYVHIFDGDEPIAANMIAAYAGVHVPGEIISTTGKMLITFRSDEGYLLFNRRALKGVYRMYECLNDCSGNGVCQLDGTCQCDSGHGGMDCSEPECGSNCPNCVAGVTSSDPYCRCADGFSGANCTEMEEEDQWFSLNGPLVPATVGDLSTDRRLNGLSGLTTVHDDVNDRAWSFGGFDLRTYFNTLIKLDFATQTTTAYTAVGTWPSGRYLHSTVLSGSTMVVFGGSDNVASYKSDLWYANLAVDPPTWEQVTATGSSPPATMGHSASVVGGNMYIYGGITDARGITAGLYKLTIASRTWVSIEPLGTAPDGVWRHSAVVYQGTKLLFFGGSRVYAHVVSGDRRVDWSDERTSYVTTYDTVTNSWDVILPKASCSFLEDCYARTSHSAAIVDDRYMLVFGGCPFKHGYSVTGTGGTYVYNDVECMTNDLLVLDLACPTELGWVTFPASSNVIGAPMARSSHAAVFRSNSRKMAVFGGSSGDALNDVVEYVVPDNFCAHHVSKERCLVDSSPCVWNNAALSCSSFNGTTITYSENATMSEIVFQYGGSGLYTCNRTTCEAPSSVPEAHPQNLYPDGCSGACLSTPGCSVCHPDQIFATSACRSEGAILFSEVTCNASTGIPVRAAMDVCSSACTVLKTCNDCQADPGCTWIGGNATNTLPTPCVASSQTTAPAAICPASCHVHGTRDTCAEAPNECSWCEGLDTCFNPWEWHTEYSFGQCIKYSGNPDNYFCENRTSCSDCLGTARCGWCAEPGGLGEGSCTTASSSSDTSCVTGSANATDPDSWAYFQCPDLDECALDTHRCSTLRNRTVPVHGANATCVNLDNNLARNGPDYRCDCDPGYVHAPGNTFQCVPFCADPCVNGYCSLPGVCTCDLGWTDLNSTVLNSCEVDCGCNGHSRCSAGIGSCDQCMGNTYNESAGCDKCLDGFYGNATLLGEPYNGACFPCAQVCNGHSTSCKSGPEIPGAICSGCSGNTHGELCSECDAGYFIDPVLQLDSFNENVSLAVGEGGDGTARNGRIDEYIGRIENLAACVPCNCNGHSGTCDPVSGEQCDCMHETKTSLRSSGSGSGELQGCDTQRLAQGSCYDVQCAECNAYHTWFEGDDELQTGLDGIPVNGTMCYRVISEMELHSGTLLTTDAVGYKLKKKFKNVHIRVYVRATVPSEINVYVMLDQSATRINFTHPVTEVDTSQELGSFYPMRAQQEFLVWDYESNSFELNELHIVVERSYASAVGDPQYEIFFTQAQVTNLHLFVFFTSFFAAFFLVLFLVGMVFTLKAQQIQRHMAVQEAVELENMSHRPMATVRLLLSTQPAGHRQAVAIASLQSSNQLKTTPVSQQPHVKGNACVSGFVLEFPTDTTCYYRNFYLGVALSKGEAQRPIPPIEELTAEEDGSQTRSPPASPGGIGNTAL